MVQTTPVYSLPYPENGDSPTVPTHVQDLAEAVEAAVQDYAAAHALLYDQMSADAAGISSTTLVTMMTVTLPTPGTYFFECFLIWTSTGAAGRPGFAIGGTSTPTAWRWAPLTVHYNSTAASQAGVSANGTSYPSSTGGTQVTVTDWSTTTGFSGTIIRGTVTVSAAGTLTFRVNRASGTSTVNVKAGSIATAQLTGA